jgi:hypothetical protein
MKVVSKRRQEEPPVEGARALLKTISRIRGSELVPRGVYRFAKFEEADEWMIRELVNTRVHLKSKMS